MRLFLVHCGFYDADLCDGLYESHVNFFVVAENASDARSIAKKLPQFASKKMHVDGLQEIHSVDGYRISLEHDSTLNEQTQITNHKHRDLAPKPETT